MTKSLNCYINRKTGKKNYHEVIISVMNLCNN